MVDANGSCRTDRWASAKDIGWMVSISKVTLAGVASVAPAMSLANTSKV